MPSDEKCDENVGGLGCWWQKSSLVLLGGHRLEIAAVAAVEIDMDLFPRAFEAIVPATVFAGALAAGSLEFVVDHQVSQGRIGQCGNATGE